MGPWRPRGAALRAGPCPPPRPSHPHPASGAGGAGCVGRGAAQLLLPASAMQSNPRDARRRAWRRTLHAARQRAPAHLSSPLRTSRSTALSVNEKPKTSARQVRSSPLSTPSTNYRDQGHCSTGTRRGQEREPGKRRGLGLEVPLAPHPTPPTFRCRPLLLQSKPSSSSLGVVALPREPAAAWA